MDGERHSLLAAREGKRKVSRGGSAEAVVGRAFEAVGGPWERCSLRRRRSPTSARRNTPGMRSIKMKKPAEPATERKNMLVSRPLDNARSSVIEPSLTVGLLPRLLTVLTAYCSLLTAYCSLLTAHCLLTIPVPVSLSPYSA